LEDKLAYLVNSTELEIDIQVLLVKSLQTRVEQTRHQRRLGSLDDISSGVFGSFCSDEGVQSIGKLWP
jgi:hypothetical protein